LDNFRGEAAFSTWLYQIATNLARNKYWYWWRRKRGASVSIDQSLAEDSTMTLSDILPSEGETPGEATVTQEFINQVSQCMQHLSPKHREILVLRNVQDLSYEEIAAVTRSTLSAVKSRLFKARRRLASIMKEGLADQHLAGIPVTSTQTHAVR